MRGESSKLTIQNEMRMFDSKNRAFYDELSDEEKKKFSSYLMIRCGSSVSGSPELQEYYLHATNQRLNKHFFELHKHPKLQWLCATTVSPGMGNHFHRWIGHKKKDPNEGKKLKELKTMYPNAKLRDLDVLSNIIDKKEITQYKKSLGE